MKILYVDKYLVVAEKPVGTPSQPDPSGREDMISLLEKECGAPVFCVHRLDTATGGVMVYARDSKTAGKLSSALTGQGVLKEYVCAVHAEGVGCGSMRDLLFHDKRKNKAYVTTRMRKGVKEALLEYTAVAEKDSCSLVKVRLHTGRTHQIRVQFAARKMPLCGDGKYGAKDNLPLALHCFHLAFTHPVTGRSIDITSLPPSPWFEFDLSPLE